jgi:hypothetical protein
VDSAGDDGRCWRVLKRRAVEQLGDVESCEYQSCRGVLKVSPVVKRRSGGRNGAEK